MTCPKCQGFMIADRYRWWAGWSCVNCGLVWDLLIAQNKHAQQLAAEEASARQLAEALFSK